MSNHNFVNLFKYIGILLASSMMPIIMLIFFLNFPIYEYFPSLRESDLVYSWLIINTFIFLVLIYFIIPILITIIAIKHHWSIYLDKFFNSFIVPTILFFLALVVTVIYKHLYYIGKGSTCLLYIYYAIVPQYCLIYIVVLIHNIHRKYSQQCKKLSNFINKFRNMNNE